ncbi:MAG: contractile injection system protein, VgrG/Pvc8 family [Rhodospirillales bacterium]|nr:contractile injection system protein, VgrG/Pvc8 family [Rhodospirillales bacterium]
MAEHWDLRVRGQPLNPSVARRVTDVRITTTLDATSDACEVTIAGDVPEIAVPDMGTLVRASLRNAAGDLVTMGDYALAETEIELAPKRLRIRCTAVDYTAPLKDPRTAAWDDTTLGEIVTGIAARYDGYMGAVDPALARHVIDHVDQTDESDLHFLTRLARVYDATAQIVAVRVGAGGHLIAVAPSAASASIRSGSDIPTVTITPTDLVLYGSVKRTARTDYGSVRASYQDIDAGVTVGVDVGEGEPKYRLRSSYATHAEAQAAAEAAHNRLRRETATLRLEKPGNPVLVAGNRVELQGWGEQIDTVFQITRGTHMVGSQGYTTAIEGDSVPLA